MKNRILSFFVMMSVFAILFIFASCGDGGVENPADNQNETEVTLVSSAFYSSEFVSLPNKTEYLLNETFDATGLELKLVYKDTYSDQTTKLRTLNITYPDENLEFTVPDFSTLGEKLISVVYNDGDYFPDFSFTVWVKENISSSDPVDPDPENPTVMYTTLDSISIKNLPIKTIYSLNESFDPTGLEITATYTETYSDWTTQSKNVDITYPNNMISLSEVDMTTEGTKTITLTFTENGSSLTCTFQITVKAAAFSSTINYTTFDSEINSDLSIYNGKAMTLYLDTTTVNIATLYTQFTTLLDAVKAGSVKIDFADAGKTTIEGDRLGLEMDLEQYPEDTSKFKAFFEAITPENATAESLPSISSTFGVAGNLYGTGIDKFFEKYYELGASDKLNGTDVIGSTGYFDALDYLNANGGIAYDANGDYTGNYYNLNVNAALLIGGNLKNVNIKGDISGEIAIFQGTFTNVRFDEDASGFTFSDSAHGIGLIEFAGDAPSRTPSVDSGRLVLRKVNSDTLIPGGFSLDVSALSANDIANSSISTSGISAGTPFAETIYRTTEAKNAAAVISSSVRVGNDLVFGTDYYATNQQWIDAANKNEWIEYGSSGKYPNKAKLVSKLNLDEKNNNKLLNTILFNNQKVYNS